MHIRAVSLHAHVTCIYCYYADLYFLYTPCIFIYYIQRFIVFSAIVTILHERSWLSSFPVADGAPVALPATCPYKKETQSCITTTFRLLPPCLCENALRVTKIARNRGGGGGEEVAARDPGSCMHAVVMLAYNL